MKIFYINVIEQNAGWGSECFLNRGFLVNGQETITLDYRKYRHNLARYFLSLKDDFDLLFLQRGDGFPLELLRSVRRPCFFWASELVARNRDQDRLLSSGLFKHAFVHSTTCKKTIVKKGWLNADKITVLLNGFDETVQYKLPSIDKDIDVLFVGSILPRRRMWLDRLKKRHGIVETKAFGRDMTSLFNRAKIILNIHAEDYPDTETRVFEALGCGAFLLTEKLADNNPFVSGEHLVEVNDLDAMNDAIDYYLEHEVERDIIARRGHENAICNHTYIHRAVQITSLFSLYLDSQSLPAIDVQQVKAYAKHEFLNRQLAKPRRMLKSIRGYFIK
jgi:hypothetical protein